MNLTRRNWFRLSAGSAAFTRYGAMNAFAQSTAIDYKALVCIFLFGGNDANNMVIPVYGSGYTAYASARGGSLAIAQGSLAATTITPNSLGLAYALHPAMTGLKALFDSGKLAVVANVGPLTQYQTTKALYNSNAAYRPYQLFSHSDQQSAGWPRAQT